MDLEETFFFPLVGLSGRPLIIFFFFQNGTNESEAPSVLREKQLIYEVEIANPSLEEVAMAILTPRRKKFKVLHKIWALIFG